MNFLVQVTPIETTTGDASKAPPRKPQLGPPVYMTEGQLSPLPPPFGRCSICYVPLKRRYIGEGNVEKYCPKCSEPKHLQYKIKAGTIIYEQGNTRQLRVREDIVVSIVPETPDDGRRDSIA